MHALGVSERSAINVMGHNAPEWAIGFHGALFANCVSTGSYITNLPEACLYQAQNSNCEIVLVDSIEQLKKYQVNLHQLPNIKAIVVYSLDKFPPDVKDPKFFLWNDFMKLGKDVKT